MHRSPRVARSRPYAVAMTPENGRAHWGDDGMGSSDDQLGGKVTNEDMAAHREGARTPVQELDLPTPLVLPDSRKTTTSRSALVVLAGAFVPRVYRCGDLPAVPFGPRLLDRRHPDEWTTRGSPRKRVAGARQSRLVSHRWCPANATLGAVRDDRLYCVTLRPASSWPVDHLEMLLRGGL